MIEGVILMALLASDTPGARVPESRHAAAAAAGANVYWQRNSIIGSVYNQERRPIQNLRVELLDEVDGLLKSAYTDSAGKFFFSGLSSGTFQVRVLSSGTDYEGRTERVLIQGSILRGRGGQSEQVDIVLPYKKGRGPTAATATNSAPGSVFVQEVPNPAREAYERAVRDMEGDRLNDEALASLQRAVALFPEYYAALDLLGHEYIRRQSYDAAQAVLAKAVVVNPRGFRSWYSLGYAQYKLRLLPSAVESLTRSASLNARSVNTQLVLGTVQRLLKQWAAAEEHLTRAKTLSKKPPPEVHWQLALLYNQTGRNAQAADELDLFLKAQPDSRDAEKIRKLSADLRRKR